MHSWYKTKLTKITKITKTAAYLTPEINPNSLQFAYFFKNLDSICHYLLTCKEIKKWAKLFPSSQTIGFDPNEWNSKTGTIIIDGQNGLTEEQTKAIANDTYKVLSSLHLEVNPPIFETTNSQTTIDKITKNRTVKNRIIAEIEITENYYADTVAKSIYSVFNPTSNEAPVVHMSMSKWNDILNHFGIQEVGSSTNHSLLYNAKNVKLQLQPYIHATDEELQEKTEHKYSASTILMAIGELLQLADFCINNNIENIQVS